MNTTTQREVLAANRLILCHFDSYSTALVFARWPDGALLAPTPLPASAKLDEAFSEDSALYAGDAAMQAGIETLGIGAPELKYTPDFSAWALSAEGPIAIHLLRFTTFEAPAARIEGRGGVFRPISALRGAAPLELALVRKVFDLIMGGGGK